MNEAITAASYSIHTFMFHTNIAWHVASFLYEPSTWFIAVQLRGLAQRLSGTFELWLFALLVLMKYSFEKA